MSLGEFAASRSFTLGVELELQIVNRHDYDLAPGAADTGWLLPPWLRPFCYPSRSQPRP